ncbi:MAG TPA: tyrosine recombinase [Candidatus Rifleibacterium sp.]|nr:tyrosine recombinase [Candidatus Rifleibacterium sp.]HPT45138.1 tyrosine recombinase [Candidatus Rifleibacterium sp.]
MSISELISCYLEALEKERNLSLNTVRGYRNDLTFFAEWLKTQGINETTELEALSHARIRAFWAQRRAESLSAQSMRRGQSALRGLLKYGMRHHELTKNPAENMDSPRGQRSLPKAISSEDISLLLNAPDFNTLLGMRDRAILETLYGSGLRVSELAGMTFQDIDFDNQMVRITGKGNKERLAPLTPVSCTAIQSWWAARNAQMPEQKAERHVFLNHLGTPLSTRSIARVIEKYVRQLAMQRNVTPHQFRHSFATHLLNNGADIRAVQEMLGHASLSTTQIYTRISKEKLMQAYRLSHPRSGEKA